MKKILLLLIASLAIVSCIEDNLAHKYEIIHHGNKVDTIMTSKYTYYYEDRLVDAREAGCFTEVVQIKRID